MNKFDITRHKEYRAHFDKIRKQLTKQIYQDAQKKFKAALQAQQNKLPADLEERMREKLAKYKKKLDKNLKQKKQQALAGAQRQLDAAKAVYQEKIKRLERGAQTTRKQYQSGYDDGYRARSEEYHPISRHPEFQRLMEKYACKDTSGCKPKWLPCPNCNKASSEPSLPPASKPAKKHKKRTKKAKKAKQQRKLAPLSCSRSATTEPKPYSFGIGVV